MVYMHIGLLVLGLALLVKGSDIFVESAARIAKKFGVSNMMVGLTLVAFGTSIPELASSLSAVGKGHEGIVIGNIIGSNIANIGIILATSLLFGVVTVRKRMINGDGSVMLVTGLLFYVLAFDGAITIIESVLLLVLYLLYVEFLGRYPKDYHIKQFVSDFFKLRYLITIRDRMLTRYRKKGVGKEGGKLYTAFKEGVIKDIIFSSAAGLAIVLGANFFINEAIFFAELFAIPDSLIGLSLVAIGTSLPELTVSLSAVRKGYMEMIVGNVLGSNIANTLLVVGVSGLFGTIAVNGLTLWITGPFMIILYVLLLLFMRTKLRLSVIEGSILMGLYLAFMIITFTL